MALARADCSCSRRRHSSASRRTSAARFCRSTQTRAMSRRRARRLCSRVRSVPASRPSSSDGLGPMYATKGVCRKLLRCSSMASA